MPENLHSVTLKRDICKGCTTCIKKCPTGAIRVRGGKAKIIKERCIDCGECIRVCPYRAKQAITDQMNVMQNYKYTVALPAPSMYVQFEKEYTVDKILTGLLELGFDDVFEVAAAAEIITEATKALFESGELQKPVISSACPVILRLITYRFPNVMPNILPLQAPVDVAAKLARKRAMKKTGLKAEEIGIFFITPCPAKATAVKAPIGVAESNIDGVLAMRDVCLKLEQVLSKITDVKPLSTSGRYGVGWAKNEGETKALGKDNSIAADGIVNCIKLLEAMENNRLSNLEFVELSACTGGCVGGVLTVENPYIAKHKLEKIEITSHSEEKEIIPIDELVWSAPVAYRPVMNLDTNIIAAMKKMELMENIYAGLPQIDCGACGSPTCRMFAEDIVRGFADETDCMFKLREKVHNLAIEMIELEGKLSPSMVSGKDTDYDASPGNKEHS